jgi:uncharacterized protein GlcG (DUF336 family)
MRSIFLTLLAFVSASPCHAQVRTTGSQLSLDLALEAAGESARTCGGKGWPVTVSIVDVDGNIKVQAKVDHATVHTRDSSF